MPDKIASGYLEITLKSNIDNKRVDSFKLNGEEVLGDTFIAPEESGTVTISDVVLVDGVVIETIHYHYSLGTVKIDKGVLFEGAYSLVVDIKYQTVTSWGDTVRLYEDSGNVLNSYFSKSLLDDSMIVSGDFVKVYFWATSTASYNSYYYGLKATITPVYG